MATHTRVNLYRVSEQKTVHLHLAAARSTLRMMRDETRRGCREADNLEVAELTRAVRYMGRWLMRLRSRPSADVRSRGKSNEA